MSHHLDSPLSRQDVRLNTTDLYVFRGQEGTAFVLDLNNSIAGADAPKGFHPEAQYAFRLDTDGDAVEDLTYRLTFGERDGAGNQSVELRRLEGGEARDSAAAGTVLAQGATNATITGAGGLRLWAGLAADPFYIDPTVLKATGEAFHQGTRVELGDWQPGVAKDLFDGTTVCTIVLDVPDADLLGRLGPDRRIWVWATATLATDAGGWRQINRAGHPMIQPIFGADDGDDASHYNTTAPADDVANYTDRFARTVAAVVAAHGTAADPQAYGASVASLLLPDMLPYQVGTAASYDFARHNGRTLTDNTPEVMYSLTTNSAFSAGLSKKGASGAPRDTFPYVAPPPA